MDDVQYYYSTDEVSLGIPNPDIDYCLIGDDYYSLPDDDRTKSPFKRQPTITYHVIDQGNDSQYIG